MQFSSFGVFLKKGNGSLQLWLPGTIIVIVLGAI
jgi:hypothetical protein